MILITGGTGYLAGIIANFFADKGYSVRLGTRRREVASKDLHYKVDVVDLNLLSNESLNNAIKGTSFVFHLASMNYEDSKNDPDKAKIVNEDCTQKILKASVAGNVKKIVYFSTMHIYGHNLKGNVTEQTIPAPLSVYGKTHLNAEKIVKDLSEKNNIEYLIFRLSNVSSPPIDADVNCWHLVIHDLCKQVIKKQEIELKSDGEQSRDFVHVNILNNNLEYFLKNTGLSGVYNFGSGKQTKIKDLAKVIQKEYKKIYSTNPEILLGENKMNEIEFSFNTNKLKNFFPYNESYSLEYIVSELLSYCKINFS